MVDHPIGAQAEVWVTSRTTGEQDFRGHVVVQDLREIVTHTMTGDGPNGPNGVVTQYILAAAEKQLHDGLRGAVGAGPGADRDTVLLARMVPLETFGPDVLDISRNNLRRRWATATDWLDDVIAYALRPGRADAHAEAAVATAGELLGKPLGEVVRVVAAGEVAAERDPARFGLAEMIRILWPEHPAVRNSLTTLDEYPMRWWLPVYAHVLDVYELDLIAGLSLPDFAWPLLALVEQEARGGEADGRAARAILVLMSGCVVDRCSRARLTPDEIAARVPPSPLVE